MDKTNPMDAAGWAKVLDVLKKKHRFPVAFIAKEIRQTRQSVAVWKAVPLKHVAKVSELSGIPRNKILPYTLKKMKELLR